MRRTLSLKQITGSLLSGWDVGAKVVDCQTGVWVGLVVTGGQVEDGWVGLDGVTCGDCVPGLGWFVPWVTWIPLHSGLPITAHAWLHILNFGSKTVPGGQSKWKTENHCPFPLKSTHLWNLVHVPGVAKNPARLHCTFICGGAGVGKDGGREERCWDDALDAVFRLFLFLFLPQTPATFDDRLGLASVISEIKFIN